MSQGAAWIEPERTGRAECVGVCHPPVYRPWPTSQLSWMVSIPYRFHLDRPDEWILDRAGTTLLEPTAESLDPAAGTHFKKLHWTLALDGFTTHSLCRYPNQKTSNIPRSDIRKCK